MQDVLPPINGQGRGAIRPPARLVSEDSRPVVREAVRPTRSIDGMTGARPAPVVQVAPAPIPEPVVAPAPVQLVTDVMVVAAPKVEPVVATEIAPAPQVAAPVVAPAVEPAVPVATEAKPEEKKPKKKRDWKRGALIALAVVLLLATGYVALDTWMFNSNTANQLTGTASAQGASDDGTPTAAQEGQDETKVTKESVAKYAVAADRPRALHIDKLDLSARILPMSVNKQGSIQAPLNIYDAGWYTGSVKPGEIGAMFIDGHASGPTREGLFAYLDTLKVGDTLQVEKGDGSKLSYKVVHTEVVPLGEVDMKKVLLPYGNVSRAMNLMTCTGKWLPKEYTYDHRVLIYTEQI